MEAAIPKKRTSELDAIKGVMIVLMVFGHLTYYGTSQYILTHITEVMHTFRMPLFLILCGYFFSPLRPTDQLMRRAVRGLLVPYAVFESIYIVLLMAASHHGLQTNNHIEPTLGAFFKAIVLEPVGAFWFIRAIAIFQIATAISVWVAKRFNPDIWMAILVSLIFLCYYFEILPFWAVEFLLIGLVLKQFSIGLPGSISAGVLIVAVIALSFGIPYENAAIKPNALIWAVWVLAVLSITNGLFRRFPDAPTVGIWRYLGQNTLIILLTHVYFFYVVKMFSAKLLLIDPTGIVCVSLATFAGVVGPLGVAVLIDRFGLTPLLFDKDKLYAPWKTTKKTGVELPPVAPHLVKEAS